MNPLIIVFHRNPLGGINPSEDPRGITHVPMLRNRTEPNYLRDRREESHRPRLLGGVLTIRAWIVFASVTAQHLRRSDVRFLRNDWRRMTLHCIRLVAGRYGGRISGSSHEGVGLPIGLDSRLDSENSDCPAVMGLVSPIVAALRAYSVPLILFSAAVFYQLVVIPNSFPQSHYDVLGVKRHGSVQDVEAAYKKLSSIRDQVDAVDFIKIRYAYELLTNPTWKRNYDIFGIEEQESVFAEAKTKYSGEKYDAVHLPLLGAADDSGALDDAIQSAISPDFLKSDISLARLILVYSSQSKCCTNLSVIWPSIVAHLEGIASTTAVELGNVQLAAYLAEKKTTGQPFFRSGIPSVVAFPPSCKNADCLARFDGPLTVDAVTDWIATDILNLPRIMYYSTETLIKVFFAKSSPHKVKVIFFSKTGERATPFLRVAAMHHRAHASFALVLWREEESSYWWSAFEVENAPAIVFLKDPGVKPVVHHGPVNNSLFSSLMEQNKHHVLPSLRSTTSHELGCDARGYSRAGEDVPSWYCVILAGRPSHELSDMRETIRRVQAALSNSDSLLSNEDQSPAAVALKDKRLTFTWLDGEAQRKYCFFYLHSETSYETCGPRRNMVDVPRIFIVRYKRNATEESALEKKKPKNPWEELFHEDPDPASQLVAKYNGTNEVNQIIEWISEIVKDGDSSELPFYRAKTPDLVPEMEDAIYRRSIGNVLSQRTWLTGRIQGLTVGLKDRLGDPRIGPILLMGALLSCGTVWLRQSQAKQPNPSNQVNPSNEAVSETTGLLHSEGSPGNKTKARRRKAPSGDRPASVTDAEPSNAKQLLSSDSDSN
ncbi:hypothetical protein MLD38_039380 [Melastoma candidum]|uniref:Uncharacterized protein n=1 Tax=Melastoma candidum TaxID=119954 RepID=A0ACB9L341_9MYRT|nr:hypothetical protein MLD38_039380 [Melastoma candidum]